MVVYRRCFPHLGPLKIPYQKAFTAKKEKRRHLRKACAIAVAYIVDDCLYKGVIRNVSPGGVLMNTCLWPFLGGQEISMGFLLPTSRKHARNRGRIVWVGHQEMGVRFKDMESKGWELGSFDLERREEMDSSFTTKVGTTGRVKKKRVRWQPSIGDDIVSYRLYWSKSGAVSYNSDHVELDDVTEVILPDDIPSFPLISGDIELGITAMNKAGNESDITRLKADFNFAVPDAPQNLEVEDA